VLDQKRLFPDPDQTLTFNVIPHPSLDTDPFPDPSPQKFFNGHNIKKIYKSFRSVEH